MEANPYYLKDTDGGYYNKYPEFEVWQEGKEVGRREVVEWMNQNSEYNIVNNHSMRLIVEEDLQAKLKELESK